MRRRTLLVVLAGLAVVVAVGVVVLWPTQPNRITQENCDRIKKGMSRAEVETILGPPGDHATAPLGDPDPSGVFLSSWRPYNRSLVDRVYDLFVEHEIIQWRGDAGIIAVEFTHSGHVVWAGIWPVKRAEQTPIGNLLWRLKRQWRRWFPE
jgi:hypothetical protein